MGQRRYYLLLLLDIHLWSCLCSFQIILFQVTALQVLQQELGSRVVHPLVATLPGTVLAFWIYHLIHPHTGRKVLFLSPFDRGGS